MLQPLALFGLGPRAASVRGLRVIALECRMMAQGRRSCKRRCERILGNPSIGGAVSRAGGPLLLYADPVGLEEEGPNRVVRTAFQSVSSQWRSSAFRWSVAGESATFAG